MECLESHFYLGERNRRSNKQIAELWGHWTAVRVTCNFGWRMPGQIYKGVRGKALVGFWGQQWLLKRSILLLFRHPLLVHFVFVPSLSLCRVFVTRLMPCLEQEAMCGGLSAMAVEVARADSG